MVPLHKKGTDIVSPLFDNHRKLAISSSAVFLTRAVIFPGLKENRLSFAD